MTKIISVVGAGSMGTAVSIQLARNGYHARMYSPVEAEIKMLQEEREHKDKLPGVKIPDSIEFTNDLEYTLSGTEFVALVAPSQTTRENMRKIRALGGTNKVFACFSKGLEAETGLRMSEVIRQEIPGAQVVAMSGPCHAEELARDLPTAYVAASEQRSVAELAQDIFMSPSFRVYTSPDIVGVELGGAVKNVIALCAGISDGLGFGDNTKAALMTRGIAEMQRLAQALGAQAQTLAGLAGIGDLIVTCTSMHSRNRRAGILIGAGKPLDEALREVKMVVEGVTTTKAAVLLSERHQVSMPITLAAYDVLFNGKNAKQAVYELMTREKKHEMKDVVDNSNW